jgi:hypothetical protein
MSVVKSKRGESDLAIINKSRELAVYTARICSNEKNFPKRYRWCITSKIVSDAFDIYGNIRKANTIFVKIRPDYDIRRQCQNKARGALDSLLGNMDIAYSMFGINDKRIEYWTGLVIEVQSLLRNWMKSDYERYKDLK